MSTSKFWQPIETAEYVGLDDVPLAPVFAYNEESGQSMAGCLRKNLRGHIGIRMGLFSFWPATHWAQIPPLDNQVSV